MVATGRIVGRYVLSYERDLFAHLRDDSGFQLPDKFVAARIFCITRTRELHLLMNCKVVHKYNMAPKKNDIAVVISQIVLNCNHKVVLYLSKF